VLLRSSNDGPRRKLTPSGATLIVTLAIFACAAVVLMAPRPIAPHEGPALRFGPSERSALEADWLARAARCPEGELSDAVRDALLTQGAAESRQVDMPEARIERDRAANEAVAALLASHGEAALDGCRVRSLDGLRRVRRGETSDDEAEQILGRFPVSLERYGLVRDGRRLAATEVIDILYLARWNVVFSRPMTEGLGRVERRAYYGWLALHADDAPLDARLGALEAYERLGGFGVSEARARLAFLGGDGDLALELYGKLADDGGGLRARNHALAGLVE
jgi:hypothetical protein